MGKGKRSRKRELVELGEQNQGNVQKRCICYFSIICTWFFNGKRTPQYHSQAKIDHRIFDRSIQWVKRFIWWYSSGKCIMWIRNRIWTGWRETVSRKWLACPYQNCSHFRSNWFNGLQEVKNWYFEWNKKRRIPLSRGTFKTPMYTGWFRSDCYLEIFYLMIAWWCSQQLSLRLLSAVQRASFCTVNHHFETV